MSSPLVSIITPTYNHQEFIAQCIESVQAQTYQNWEHIIIDDGSSDKTPEIIHQYANNDSRVKPIILHCNKGPRRLNENYNLGLQVSQGRWIAILEGDDYWLTKKLAIQLEEVTDDTIFCYGLYLDKIAGRLVEGKRPPFAGKIPIQKFIPYLLLHQSHMLAVTQLINRQSLLQIGGFHQDGSPAAVDMATLMHLIKLPGSVVYIPEPLGVWRHHYGQSTNLSAVEIAKFNTSLVIEFFDTQQPRSRMLNSIDRNSLITTRRDYIADAAFGLMRRKLKRGDRKNLLKLAWETWKFGRLKRKLQAVYAIFALLGGFDFEVIHKMVERLNLRPRRVYTFQNEKEIDY